MRERRWCSGLTATHWAFNKPVLGWNRYRDAKPVPTSPLVDDIATSQSESVNCFNYYNYHKGFNVHIRIKLLQRTLVVGASSDLGQPFRPMNG